MSDSFTILRELGFNPAAHGIDYGVKGLADRLARTERALEEMRQAARAASLYLPEPERTNFRREYALVDVDAWGGDPE